MRPRTLAVLTAIALLFAGYIFFVDRRLPSTDERAEREKKVLVFEPDEIAALEIAWDDRRVRLARVAENEGNEDGESDSASDGAAVDGGWHLEAPMRARADRSAVEGLLAQLAGLEKERTIEDVDRQAAGFETPRATVTLTPDGGEPIALEIGPEVPATSSMVVALAGGDDAYQVASALYEAATKAPGDWRDKAIFPGTRADIERVRLRPAGGDELLLAERGDALWLESPIVDRADRDPANALLSALAALRAERFVDDDPVTGGESDPEALGLAPSPALGIVEVQLEGRETPVVIELGAPVASADDGGSDDGDESPGDEYETAFDDPLEPPAPPDRDEVFARVGEQVFVAAGGELRQALARAPGDWRSRHWLAGIQVFEMERLEIADGDGAVTLERQDGDWLRDGEDAIDYATASDLLYALAEVRAEAVLDGGEERLGEPRLEITIATEPGLEDGSDSGAGDDEVRLTVHPGPEGTWLATESGRAARLRLAPDALAEVEAKLAAVRAATPVGEEAAGEEDGG